MYNQSGMRIFGLLRVSLIAGAVTLVAQNCSTPSGSAVPDGQVSANASFSVGNGFVTVTLANGLADPRSAGQLLSGLAFTLASGTTGGSLGSTSANLRSIAKGGSFTDLGPASTGWALNGSFNGGFFLCDLCTDLGAAGPKHLLIGDPASSGEYDSANASIAGNKPHNPFTQGTATFLINAPGAIQGDSVSSAAFYFSTTDGISVAGSCGGGGRQ